MKLVVHIGNGKTGTTSIQQTLEKSQDALSARGIYYLGRMLEHGRSETARDWQTPAGAERLLHNMPQAHVEQDVKDVLTAELAALKDQGFDTAIWSNEALFARHMGVIAALKTLESSGVEVSVVVYLRRHDKWARSAYAQWGIRHKSYQGPIKPFSEWIAERPARFGPNLSDWNDAFGAALVARNFDTVGDVVQDFLGHVGVNDLPTQRVYETPSPEELAVHAMYNDQFSGVVLPDKFHRLTASLGGLVPDAADASRLRNLFPTERDLEKVLSDSADDLETINAIFDQKDEPTLGGSDRSKIDEMPDAWTLVTYLMKSNFALTARVSALEDQLAKLLP